MDLPSELKKRGVHDIFHALLLRIHVPNNDWLFPGRTESQFQLTEDTDSEWAVECIVSHSGSGPDLIFKLLWRSGDLTWLPFDKCEHLIQLQLYLELLDVSPIGKFPMGAGKLPLESAEILIHSVELGNDLPIRQSAPNVISRRRQVFCRSNHLFTR